MKMYLSSYKLGNELEKLKTLIPPNKKTGYIPNALDYSSADPVRRASHIEADIQSLKEVGLDVELLDLKDYLGKKNELKNKIQGYGAIWVSGGNVFVLRQAMKLSGFDDLLKDLNSRENFLYGAYSAGVCVLSPTLDGYQIVDNATDTPYEGLKTVLWDGLGLIDYTFLPHYQSGHKESDDIEKELQYCIEKRLPYKTLRDGEVIIVE